MEIQSLEISIRVLIADLDLYLLDDRERGGANGQQNPASHQSNDQPLACRTLRQKINVANRPRSAQYSLSKACLAFHFSYTWPSCRPGLSNYMRSRDDIS
jgi:hypothetical protein